MFFKDITNKGFFTMIIIHPSFFLGRYHMAQPMVEKLPEFIMTEGRKDLSLEKFTHLNNLIKKMNLVRIEDKAEALNRTGIIYTYMNDFDKALESFQASLQYGCTEISFSNYLQALERIGEYKKALNEGEKYLDLHPNNRRVFQTLFSIAHKYPSDSSRSQVLKFLNYQMDSSNFDSDYKNVKDELESEMALLKNLEIDLEYYNLISNLAFVEVKKIQIGPVDFHTFLNDAAQLSIMIVAKGISTSDIRLLNKNFDLRIQELIDNKVISFDKYAEQMTKFVHSFGIASDVTEAA